MTILAHRTWEWEDPLVLVGFPSQGLVGAIVASYLVPKLDMELVASMDSRWFPPIASIRDGRAHAPVQIFASTIRCGLDGDCDQLVVVRSAAAPPPQHADEISREILDYAEDIGSELVVTLEGAPMADGSDEVYSVPNLPCDVDLSELDTTPFPDGALSGISASLLVEGNNHDHPVLCLFTGVREELPDAAGAARLVEVADALVPGIRMEPEPLKEQAEEFEKNLRASLEEQKRSMEEMPHASEIMYG